MPSQRNVELLNKLQEKVDRASAIFFVHYQGLSHQQMEELRQSLDDIDSEFLIIKNTLTDLALKERNVDAGEQLTGPMALLLAYSDPVAPAKKLVEFAKKYDLPEIQFGYFEGDLIEATQVRQLSQIPPRGELLGKLVGGLSAPITALAYNLNYPIQRLALVMRGVEEKKQKQA